MILLDTNVLSAVMRRDADPIAIAWLDTQLPDAIWTTTITIFEIRFGLEILAEGRRRRALEQAFSQALEHDLGGRVVAFDQAAAEAAAGIAAARQATLATRNRRHFEGTGISPINPGPDKGRFAAVAPPPRPPRAGLGIVAKPPEAALSCP